MHISYAGASSILLAVVVTMTPSLAQDQPPAQSKSYSFKDRVSFGVRAGGLIFPLEESQSSVDSSVPADPLLSTTFSSNSSAQRFTVGPTVHITISDRLGINLDFLYKRSGYDASDVINLVDADSGEVEEIVSRKLERTRADYWDIPILLRYYQYGPDERGMRPYFTGGVSFRNVTNVVTLRESIDEDGFRETDRTAATPANKTLLGAVAGAGIQLRSENGLKVEIGARFTRWFKRAFDSGVVQSNLNQGEAFLGLTF